MRDSLAGGSIHLAMGTYGVPAIRTLAEAHAKAGQVLVAGPVLGRPDLAASGQLGIVAAGPQESVKRMRALADVDRRRTFQSGTKPETATAIKLANNMVWAPSSLRRPKHFRWYVSMVSLPRSGSKSWTDSQQQNEGDSPSGQIHFVVRADDEKKFYLSPAIDPGELLSEIVPNGFLLTPWPEVTHRQLIRHDRSENFNGCGKCLALLISSSGSEVTVAAYSLRLPEPLSIS